MQFATVQPIITDDEAAALARTMVNLFRAWELTDAEARTLLGDMAQRTWARWKTGDIGRIDRDLRARMAILMGIHKGLRLLFNGPLTYGWPKTANTGPRFNGRSPVQVMGDGGIPAMMNVRQHIDALRGGV